MGPVFDTSRVSPLDAVATLRSLRRRFSQVLIVAPAAGAVVDPGAEDDEALDASGGGHPAAVEAILRRRPEAGRSPIEHADWVATALARGGHALRQVMIEDNPTIDLPPVNVDPPVPGASASASAQEVVARVGDAAEALANSMAQIHGADWTRTGRAATGEVVTALDIARLAVRIGIEHLRGAEQALATLRKGP